MLEKAGVGEKKPKEELKIKSGLPSLRREEGDCPGQSSDSDSAEGSLYEARLVQDFVLLRNMVASRGAKASMASISPHC